MNRKSILLSSCLVAALCSGKASAQNEGTVKMIVTMSDSSSPKSFNLDDVRKLTFGDEGVEIWKNGQAATETFLYGKVRNFRFEGIVDGIETVVSDYAGRGLIPVCNDATLRILGWNGEPTTLRIFNLVGIEMLAVSRWNGENVDVSTLSKGTYILKVNNQSVKFIK